LLLTWWLYLYLFIVIPWQIRSLHRSCVAAVSTVLYAFEQMVLIWR